MLNKHEHLLVCLNEECAEIGQRIDKALRFGINEIQPGQSLSNSERILDEMVDFIAVMEMAVDAGLILDPRLEGAMIALKKEKVHKYMEYAQRVGAMEATNVN